MLEGKKCYGKNKAEWGDGMGVQGKEKEDPTVQQDGRIIEKGTLSRTEGGREHICCSKCMDESSHCPYGQNDSIETIN